MRTIRFNLSSIPVYYINLASAPEKAEATERVLKTAGFTNITRFEGIHSDIRAVGCASSHNALLKQLSEEKTPFLVVEDDIEILQPISHIEVPANADALYLGISKYGLYRSFGERRISAEKVSPDMYQIYNMLGAHAVIYFNSDYVKWLERTSRFLAYTKQDNQDKGRAETMKYFNVYALNTPLFYQLGENEQHTKFSIDDHDDLQPMIGCL